MPKTGFRGGKGGAALGERVAFFFPTAGKTPSSSEAELVSIISSLGLLFPLQQDTENRFAFNI